MYLQARSLALNLLQSTLHCHCTFSDGLLGLSTNCELIDIFVDGKYTDAVGFNQKSVSFFTVRCLGPRIQDCVGMMDRYLSLFDHLVILSPGTLLSLRSLMVFNSFCVVLLCFTLYFMDYKHDWNSELYFVHF